VICHLYVKNALSTEASWAYKTTIFLLNNGTNEWINFSAYLLQCPHSYNYLHLAKGFTSRECEKERQLLASLRPKRENAFSTVFMCQMRTGMTTRKI
jgi:hypothetical protein